MATKGIHANHRQRMKDKFKKEGIATFEDHEILEMLLFYAIPRVNTNEIAHNLLDRFGGLTQVFSADPAELCEIKGMGENSAEYIRFIGEIFREITSEMFNHTPIDSGDAAGLYTSLLLKQSPAENAVAIYLDGNGIRIAEEWLSGRNIGTEALCTSIIGKAKELGAESIVVAHSHRHEPAVSSPDDDFIDRVLKSEAEKAGIRKVFDIIVADDEYVIM